MSDNKAWIVTIWFVFMNSMWSAIHDCDTSWWVWFPIGAFIFSAQWIVIYRISNVPGRGKSNHEG